MRVGEWTVSADAAGRRLDKYLRRALHDLPLGRIFKLLRERKVRVNGRPARGDQLLAVGDRIEVRGVVAAPAPARVAARVARVTFRILFEDDHLLVVDKPAGLATHAGSGIHDATLVDEVRAFLRTPVDLPATEFAPSPAHRLDRGTSGVLVVAKTRKATVALAAAFEAKAGVTKTYVGLAQGRFARSSGVVTFALEERQQSQRSRRERGRVLQPASTRYRVLGSTPQASLVLLTIDTGRTHQIRRHLQAMGHPLAGDGRYGDPAFNRVARERWGLERLFLHALRLQLAHPVSGEPLRLEAQLPAELTRVVGRLGLESVLAQLAST